MRQSLEVASIQVLGVILYWRIHSVYTWHRLIIGIRLHIRLHTNKGWAGGQAEANRGLFVVVSDCVDAHVYIQSSHKSGSDEASLLETLGEGTLRWIGKTGGEEGSVGHGKEHGNWQTSELACDGRWLSL